MSKTITISEWERLKIDHEYSGVIFKEAHFNALMKWQESQGDKYFEAGHRYLKFNQWVGVIQVNQLTIEVLPKIGKNSDDHGIWKNALIDMLKVSGHLKLRSTEKSHLATRKQSLFDLYLESYLNEVETLIHRGLIKQYRKEKANRTDLKGKLLVAGQIKHNLVHKERFYTEAAVYDKFNIWNVILLQALKVVSKITKSGLIKAKALNLQLHFPGWPDKTISREDFNALNFNRKTNDYQNAIDLARLILLRLNPKISSGKENVQAIFFDMNTLWENWLLTMFKRQLKANDEFTVLGKRKPIFWESESSSSKKRIESDILIRDNREGSQANNIVIDAKWKDMSNKRSPDDNDLKQMYVYNEKWDSKQAWLVYPTIAKREVINGTFSCGKNKQAGMAFIKLFNDKQQLIRKINFRLENDLIENE